MASEGIVRFGFLLFRFFAFVELLQEVEGFGFLGVEFEELLEDFAAFGEIIFGDEAACESASRFVEVGVVALVSGEFSLEASGESIEAVFVGEAVVPLGEGDVAVFEGEFSKDAVGFEEASAVGDEVEEFIAGDFEFGTGDHGVDFLEVEIAFESTGGGFEGEFPFGDFFQAEEGGLPVGGCGEFTT